MNFTELSRVIEQVGKDRGIKREIIIGAVEQAILSAAQKKYGLEAVLEAQYNPDTGEVEVFQFKQVVATEDDIVDEENEISLVDAQKLDPEVTVGDELGIRLDNAKFGRIDAQAAKQIIFQKVRDAERDIIFDEFVQRKGEIITGIARRVERGNLIIDLGRTDAILPRREIIPNESFKPGDRVQAYLADVVLSTRGPQLYLTRTAPQFLMKLFENEVPEMSDGIVEIRAAIREPGVRAKLAVYSRDRDVDPVGACVGMKGTRVQNVINELRGEKIDIIPWNDNPVQFVKAALQPAEISFVRIHHDRHSMEIIVEDNQLSLAIGRRGQNVQLASGLTGWQLDIVSKSKLTKRTADAVYQLKHIDGVTDTLAHGLFQGGYSTVFQVAEADLENLMRIPGFETQESAEELRKNAQETVEKKGDALLAHIRETQEAQMSERDRSKNKPIAENTTEASQSPSSSEEKA